MKERPFKGTNPDELASAIMFNTPVNIQSFKRKVTPKLFEIISKCLEKKKEDRYKSFKELATDLDNVIKFDSSPKKGWFLSHDERVKIDDENLEMAWNYYFFKDRLPTNVLNVTIDMTGIDAFERAVNFSRLGQYDKVIESCDKILGNINDTTSNVSLMLKGHPIKLESNLTRDNKYSIGSLKEIVLECLYMKMTALINIIEETPNGKNYIKDLLVICNKIEASKFSNNRISILCSQGYKFAGQLKKAEDILWAIVNENLKDTHAWLTLFLIVEEQKDYKKLEVIGKRIFEEHGKEENAKSQYICAKIFAVVKNWKSAAHFAQNAYVLDPNHLDTIYICVASLLNTKRIEEAYYYYKKMEQLAPDSIYTLKMRQIFVDILE